MIYFYVQKRICACIIIFKKIMMLLALFEKDRNLENWYLESIH